MLYYGQIPRYSQTHSSGILIYTYTQIPRCTTIRI